MATKLIAAELATGAGVATVICHGSKPDNILPIASATPPMPTDAEPALLGPPSTSAPIASSEASTPLHTLFLPKSSPLSDRKFWIAYGLSPRGSVVIDAGAYRAISRDSGGRLLAAGVLRVEGSFMAGQAVRVWVAKGQPGRQSHRGDSRSRRAPSDRSGDNTPVGARSLSNSLSDLGSSAVSEEVPAQNGPVSVDVDAATANEGREDLEEVGRGLANYHAFEIDKIKGLRRCVCQSPTATHSSHAVRQLGD